MGEKLFSGLKKSLNKTLFILFRHDSSLPARDSLRVGVIFLALLGTEQITPPIVSKVYTAS